MSEKLPINGFKWVNDISGINKKFVKSYDKKNSDKGYILEVDVDYPSKLHKLHSDMPFLPEKMKIDKTQKLVCNLRDKNPTKKSFHHSGEIPVEFHWSHGKLLENDWNKWNLWNSSEISLEFQQFIILIPLKFHL